jgi:DNA polymerase III alpha subunit (gram-positive type)
VHLLAFDTETGGLEPGVHSLLTAYFCVLDSETWEMIDELDLKMKPEDGKYNVQPKAMEINGIDLDEHDKVAITYKEAASELKKFLIKNKIKGKRTHYMPLGQNIAFDLNFLKAYILTDDELRKLGVYYGAMDTKNIVDFLKLIGIFPDYMKTNLGAIVEHLGLPKRNAHEAKDDVLMTVDVFKALVDLFKERKDNFGALSTKLILEVIE